MMQKAIVNSDSESIKHLVNVDNKFAVLYRLTGEISYPVNNDPFSSIVETIIGQMLSNKVAKVFKDRLVKICHTGKIDAASVQKLSIAELRNIGISGSKARYILDFASAYNHADYSSKKLSGLTDDEIIKRITLHKGLGIWSAKMFLLFVLCRENVLPYEDVAFLQAFTWYNGLPSIPGVEEIKEICHKWSPYSSIAARYLYIALDRGLTKESFTSYM
jgi:DNA-3-methyladenine glycosylase II